MNFRTRSWWFVFLKPFDKDVSEKRCGICMKQKADCGKIRR